jgi:hypothetical protein
MQGMLGDYDQKDVYCAVLTVTVNMFHAIDDKALRERFERDYIKALGFLSAVEEQFQPITVAPSDPSDELVGTMIRHIFRSIELGLAIPDWEVEEWHCQDYREDQPRLLPNLRSKPPRLPASTARRRLKLAWQLRLATGQVISIFDTGTIVVQGTGPEPVERLLNAHRPTEVWSRIDLTPSRLHATQEATVEYLEIVGYKVVAEERRARCGRPGWLLKLRADDEIAAHDAVWIDDEGGVWVLSKNDYLKRLFRRTW